MVTHRKSSIRNHRKYQTTLKFLLQNTGHPRCAADRDRFAFSLCENYGSHQFLNWRQPVSTGHRHSDGFDPSCNGTKKGHPVGVSFFGAADRDRTGTDFTPRDFKSLVSACSTTAAWRLTVMVSHFYSSVKPYS